jgi:hypothetical protein
MYGRIFLIGLAISFVFAKCHPGHDKKKYTIHRSFYYWKTVFQYTDFAERIIKKEGVQQLYIKFFDVDWNYSTRKPFPLATIHFADKPDPHLRVVPVVFITNRCLNQVDSSSIAELADHVAILLKDISETAKIDSIREIQIDCDWTEKTRGKYFYLIDQLRRTDFVADKQLSATIRLYQVKYYLRTGVPPVDKGMLMAYNMGNLKNPGTANSILDVTEMDKYIKDLHDYPLHLDLALPLFSWYVWFTQDNRYKGLVHDYELGSVTDLPVQKISNNKFVFTRDCDTTGFFFKRGDQLRKEESTLADILKAGQLLSHRLAGDSLTLSCFHLDSVILDKYPPDALEKIFDCLND